MVGDGPDLAPTFMCRAIARGQSAMILCVTLNPCLDKSLTVPPWSHGETVRGLAVHEVVGGKGNNVARALSRLGRPDVRPVTFLGGAVGRRCQELLLRDDRLDPLITPVEASTREILTVRTEGTADQTAFFDPNPAITSEEADSLARSVEEAMASGTVQALTLSGSSPSPSTHGLYSDLICLARARKIAVFLDTYGPALDAIWGFWPDVIQLNLREAAMHLGLPKGHPSETDVLDLLDRWSRHGVSVAVVTDGPNRFLARIRGTTYRVRPPAIEPVNPIGSGDCFLAGLVDGTLKGLEPEPLLRLAVSCAVANALVWDAADLHPEALGEIEARVGVEILNRDPRG
ncbi:MAG: fructose-phosphate kinase/fructose-6-phosphate kinase [Planctomycetota bacterium]|nr:fructose-phosphate kinase/fructose-6-phosphate kinase [Planctomycetota bacterium]